MQGTEGERSGSYTESDIDEDMHRLTSNLNKTTEDDADVDAVAMLLGLSSSAQAEESKATTLFKPRAPPPSRAKRPLPAIDVAEYPDVTRKGASRLGPGDNRVRPPKAATKLFPEAKWRHIRLPDVESALEAEDLVVLWAHYRCPDVLSRHTAEGHLNYQLKHYNGEW